MRNEETDFAGSLIRKMYMESNGSVDDFIDQMMKKYTIVQYEYLKFNEPVKDFYAEMFIIVDTGIVQCYYYAEPNTWFAKY